MKTRGVVVVSVLASLATLWVVQVVTHSPQHPGPWEYGPWPKAHYSRSTWLQVAPRFCRPSDTTTTTLPPRENELRFGAPSGMPVPPSDRLFASLRPGECTGRLSPAALDLMFRTGIGMPGWGASAEDSDRREILRLGDERHPLLVVSIGSTGHLRIAYRREPWVRVKGRE